MSEQTQYNSNIIGIDVAKDKLDIHHLTSSEALCIKNDKSAIQRFINKNKANATNTLVVCENTGGYERTLRMMLQDNHFNVHVAHATQAHYFAKQKGILAKTDKIDARTLALFGKQEELKPTNSLTKQSIKLRELATRRAHLIEQQTAEKCRDKSFLCTELRKSIQRHIKFIEQEVELIGLKIKQIIDKDQELKQKSIRMQTVNSVGEKTAIMLIGLLPELGSISRAQIASLCGLAPINRDSGIKAGKRFVSGGRFYVRKALYMCAVCAIQHNPTMKKYYAELKNRGKESKVAITAIMRKLIITLNAMLRDDKDWCSN